MVDTRVHHTGLLQYCIMQHNLRSNTTDATSLRQGMLSKDVSAYGSNSCYQTPYFSSSGSAWVQSEDQALWLMVSMKESDYEIRSRQLSLYPDRALEQCYHPRFGQKLYKVNSTLWLSLEIRGVPLEMIDLIFTSH